MPDSTNFARTYLNETSLLCQSIDVDQIERLAIELSQLKDRLFVLGIGGSAANASHAVNDFRKLCGIEAYAPTDNVAELTARTNDDGWAHVFDEWLRTSRLGSWDALLILSVGGGSVDLSRNLAYAIEYAKKREAEVWAIVGRPDGYAAQHADIAVVVNSPERLTPHAEECQSILLHLLVSHPLLKRQEPAWEALSLSKSI